MKHAIASLRLSLDDTGAPYYQQLMAQLQQGIVSGELSVGDKLPSSRFLASSLGVSRSTTSRAYDQLIAEGILTSEAKRGVFVAALPMVSHRSTTLSSSAPFSVNKAPSKRAFDAGADVSVFPNKEWAASMRRSWLNPDLAVLEGGYTAGYPDLKAAIVDYLYRVRGLECSTEQIIVTAGSRDSLLLLQHAIALLGDVDSLPMKWWLEEPTYPPIRQVIPSSAEAGLLLIDESGPCLPDTEHASNVAVVTPNRQYPLGMSISAARRQQWLQALQNGSPSWWLIEDDYDNEFVYQGRSSVPFMQTASVHSQTRDRVFFVGSFSKVLFRGLRLGFIVAPTKHIETLHKSQRVLGTSASLPIQPAVADFMLQGHFDRHVNRMRRHYRLKRDVLLVLLERHLTTWFEWKKPHGGMHVLIELKPNFVPKKQTEMALDQLITQEVNLEGVRLFPLSGHYVYGRKEPNNSRFGFLLGFSGPKEEEMTYIVNILQKWLSENLVEKKPYQL
ncbi:PLP-dependent aminotransferase family protein [Marinomonas rhizomae]|uniref:GntR family transcriptional regulator n=1 Tax=Marinomonas rhizomae TaxID=491948 RepID=A0A366JGV9_9GAMM|nr:PLP-dependent aminotransferase family protein [Marinomonas rhizomae]RBP85058.1 GntR family transcriptional regulator [Marinomonas rhizomae]RNF76171.1 PLP-dependent aminotransferase family protein [Marinomonas rhizomae]